MKIGKFKENIKNILKEDFPEENESNEERRLKNNREKA